MATKKGNGRSLPQLDEIGLVFLSIPNQLNKYLLMYGQCGLPSEGVPSPIYDQITICDQEQVRETPAFYQEAPS